MSAGDLEHQLEALHGTSFGWALACCRWNRDEAADVLQAVYLKVLEGKARFDGRSSLRTWLFAVIRRTAAEHRRRRWVRALAMDRWMARRPASSAAGDPEAGLAGGETVRALRTALEALPRRQREVIHLVFSEELTIADAASVLGIGVGSARTHYERAKHRLRQELAARGPRSR